MIYFITNEPQHLEKYRKKLFDGIEVLEDNRVCRTFFQSRIVEIYENCLGYDVESNGLDAWNNNTILKIFGNEKIQFIFHTPYCNIQPYLDFIKEYKLCLLGHNIKFDLKFLITENNLLYTNIYDTMLAEQRIYMKSTLSVSLANLCVRYLEVFPDAMDKNIRNEFIDVDVKTFKVEPRHLYYGASDVSNLFPIKEKQEILMEKYDVTYLVKEIEFPMIPIIAKAEITGFDFNSKEWLEIYDENVIKKFEVECKLDKEIRKLRDNAYPKEHPNRMYMLGGKWDNIRKHNPLEKLFNTDGSTNVPDLFGGTMSKKSLTGVKKKVNLMPNNINYGSDTQVMEIFGRLEEPLLTKADILAVPQFTKTQKVDKSLHSYQTNEPSLHSYLTELPNSSMRTFIEDLLQHRTLSKATSTYGANFVNYLNDITNKIHTTFRQCFTDTGRMSSGGGKLEPDKPNFQNIPAKAEYAIKMRNCFMAEEGYSIGTHDLSGAELIIMCSLSQDMNLLEISKGDMHSFVAQNCWRRIYNYRAHKLKEQHDRLRYRYGIKYRDEAIIKELNKNIRLSKEFIVDKTTKKLRTAFKPLTFGVIYGMYAGKAAKTVNSEMSKVGISINIVKEEGQIIIDFIKKTFPNVIRMVEEASMFARSHGYLVLNERTKSRAWFPAIIEALRENLDFSDYRTRKAYPILSARVNKEESEARNIKIQGTQADMIKECTIEIQKWIDNNDLSNEITILSWVHDEIVDQHPNWMNGKSIQWKRQGGKDMELTYNNHIYNNFPELKAQIMRDTCNKYLINVTMDVGYDVEPYWTK